MNDLVKMLASLSPDKRSALANLLNPLSQGRQEKEAEPIAIIGMACRFPGDATDPEAFWHLLRDGKDAITEVPRERWNIAEYYNPDPMAPGKMNTRWGGFLSDIRGFDAAFFDISPREAMYMDPQQRLFLEVAWEALEQAGQSAEQLANSQTGVFVGVYNDDYSLLTTKDARTLDAYAGLGGELGIIANRLSYFLDLQGPSMAIDTACSSSLVSLHLACQSLRNKECNLAITGGVNVMVSPEMTILTTRGNMTSPDGRCKTFDARADGITRGEGCGVVVLKRLSQAQADHDPILGIVRGSAVNQDGHSNGLTAPNALSQQAVLLQALQQGNVKPEEVSYIETHGTGTALGDPIEVSALTRVYSTHRERENPCVLGAVKTNIGHLEAASGIAGLIKVLLSFQHEEIPANLHFQRLNPHIHLQDTAFVLPTSAQPWPATARKRYAAVSAFGLGGTNAHVVVEEPPARPSQSTPVSEKEYYLLPISAQSIKALKGLAQAYQQFFSTGPAYSLQDLCYTASVRRSHLKQRFYLVGNSYQELADSLSLYLQGEGDIFSPAREKAAASSQNSKLIWVFGGQGTQWAGMARQMLLRWPLVRQHLERCDQLISTLTGWSLLDVLTDDLLSPRLHDTAVA
ncbi:MAG: acyltransferase domain-containing protein, partial [Ktedonobacteraceae bacterium]|nr:acyltransferase domain-containing protein [Ktedonobacteraceae bacterium]